MYAYKHVHVCKIGNNEVPGMQLHWFIFIVTINSVLIQLKQNDRPFNLQIFVLILSYFSGVV